VLGAGVLQKANQPIEKMQFSIFVCTSNRDKFYLPKAHRKQFRLGDGLLGRAMDSGKTALIVNPLEDVSTSFT
jgi:hypothetical protein